jgi:hypothetical protein
MSDFTASIDAFARRTQSTLGEAARAIKISLFSGVIADTRVDTGRLRGNWQTSTGSPRRNEIERLDPSGTAATAEVSANVKADTVDYITNNLPYAAVWNRNDGIIDRNLARITRIVEEATRGQR